MFFFNKFILIYIIIIKIPCPKTNFCRSHTADIEPATYCAAAGLPTT